MPNGPAPPAVPFIPCIPKRLPPELVIRAAQLSAEENPANALPLELLAGELGDDADKILTPHRIALMTNVYWGPKGLADVPVSFMENTSQELINKILYFANLWNKEGANIKYRWSARDGWCRISRGSGGYYCFLGNQNKSIPLNEHNMNLEAFTLKTPDSEYHRVVCHEFGHFKGCPHEHMRKEYVEQLDVKATIRWGAEVLGWPRRDVIQQILTALDDRSIMGTPADQDSIMCYQLPGSITKSGQPIRGGDRINPTDYKFITLKYPGAVAPPVEPPPLAGIVRVKEKKTIWLNDIETQDVVLEYDLKPKA